MAAGIAGAKLMILDSENHIPLEHDCCWPAARTALRSFLKMRALAHA
jgi:hypothetical protein